MKTKLFNNLLLKVLSVIAAILLWLVVVNINDAVSSKSFKNIKVSTINMDAITSQGQTVRVDEDTDSVDIVVYARRSVLDKLKASDFVATADMQKDLRFDSMVKIEVAYTGDYNIDRIEQRRENVLVHIEEEVTEQFKVSVGSIGSPSDGLALGSMVPEQSLVEITGPKSVVERIKRVEANVNIVGITGTQIRTCKLELKDGDGDPIDGTYLEYVGKDAEFEVKVTILNKKLVGISFDVSKAAPEGYGLSSITYKPETVNIAGQKSQISGIYNLNIPPEALNPEGKTGKLEQTVDISQYLENGIIIPDENDREIVVTMEILPLQTVSYIFSPDQIQYSGVQEDLELDFAESSELEIQVSGLETELSSLTKEMVSVNADVSGVRKAGTYAIPVTVTLPSGFSCPEDLQATIKLVRAEEE